MNIYDELKNYYENLISVKGIKNDNINIYIKTLSSEEAIGNPIRQDYPLLVGKEVLIEANYKGSKGQAFSSARSTISCSLKDLDNLKIGENVYDTSLFIATLNAVMKHFNLTENTCHCKNEEPEECSKKIASFLEHNNYKNILLIGYQPAMLEHISKSSLNVRCLDLNPDNVGDTRYNILIEHGDIYKDAIKWSDSVLCTGSTITNGSITNFLNINKPVYFYGTTIAGAANILNLNRLCYKSM